VSATVAVKQSEPPSKGSKSRAWTLGIVSLGLFMVVLDNLVVTVALPSIHRSLGASIQSLEWTVNAYVLSYAVLLLTGAALGDRFGRRRMFVIGLTLFTASSAAAALAPSIALLIAARALQGLGGAIITPLTLTLLADAFPPAQRGLALGVWSGISGIAVALGPLVGGAMIQVASWHWIFWINVPIGATLAPIAARRLSESHGPARTLDLRGLGLASAGLFAIVFGVIRAQTLGWTAHEVLISLIAGVALVIGFIVTELRSDEPMLPMEFFKRRSFAVTNAVSLSMYFGMFGSIFFMSQYLQSVLGNSALQAGVKMLVWTGSTMVVAPLAGILSERLGSRPFLIAGLALQAIALVWLASLASVHQTYLSMVIPFIFGGSGMALVFAPAANAVLSSVRTDQAGIASGATNAIRELGGVLGVAVLSTVFTAHGSYASGQDFVNGLVPAMWVGGAVLACGSLLALALPFNTRNREVTVATAAPAAV
jgi:EmrB/QacA subfamily drug resistance transporter